MAKPGSSFHLALSLVEWGRMTNFSSEGQDLLDHSALFRGIVGVQVERHRGSARSFVSLVYESVFKCYVYAVPLPYVDGHIPHFKPLLVVGVLLKDMTACTCTAKDPSASLYAEARVMVEICVSTLHSPVIGFFEATIIGSLSCEVCHLLESGCPRLLG